MPVYKDKERNTWYCSFYYSNWKGEKKLKKKRGFLTKKEAVSFECNFLETQQSDLNMNFENFWNIYLKDMEVRLRENTIITKKYIVELKILPYFKDKAINDIKPSDIRQWQNELINESINNSKVRELCNCDDRKAKYYIDKMVKEGIIEGKGVKRYRVYVRI